MFNNMKIAVKLGLSFALILILLGVTVVLGLNNISKLADNADNMMDNHKKVVLVDQISIATFDNGRQIRNLLLVDDETKKADFKAIIQKNRHGNAAKMQQLKELVRSEEGKKLLANVDDRRNELGKKYEPLFDLLADKKNGKTAANEYLQKEFA